MAVTLGEEIMLLSLDDDSGAAKDRQSAGWAVAGGILLDLVMAGRVSVDDGRVRVTDQAPTGVALLDGRLEQLASWAGRRRRPPKVTEWLTKDHSKAVTATVESLRERGLVAEEQHKVLGLFPVKRYPEADGTAERELRERLAAVVLEGSDPDDRTAGLVALIHSAKLHRIAFPGVPRKKLSARMSAVSEGQWAGESRGHRGDGGRGGGLTPRQVRHRAPRRPKSVVRRPGTWLTFRTYRRVAQQQSAGLGTRRARGRNPPRRLMNENAEKQPLTAAPSYAYGQLTKAFTTALTHQDAGTRTRAQERMRRWRDVLDGMADGRLRIGSRTPVAGLPAWVTPEVVHGGFTTGNAAAGGPLLPYEAEAAREAGVPADRRALFDHFLTEPGLVTLWELLDSGRYSVAVPEEAALLTVAWLVRAGEVARALELVRTLEPFAGRLRFLPRPSDVPPPDTLAVHRRTVADAGQALARRGTNVAVETQREALTVWLPFADELLAHWLETTGPGEVPADGDWLERGAELLRRYRLLAQEHTLCGKHRRPKENLAVLRGALEEAVAGRPLDARRLGLLRHAVTSMVRKRGTPGSERHTTLRHKQADQAALPSHHALAQVVLRRLSGLPQHVGAADVAPLVTPVTHQEHRDTGLPAGAEIPAAIRQVVEAALSAPIGTLVERGVVPSAEVLAELVPQLVAATTAQAYEDESLRTLMAAAYRAFRNRRSLLLLDLERQVRIEELPWVQAVADRRESGPATEEPALTALRQLGELAVQAFPGTLLPNPLVRELGVLARQADLGAPLVEELAADIFMGTFGPKFLRAARDAAELLRGTLYERYYGIDYAAVRNMAVVEAGEALTRSYVARTSPGFARLCTERAGHGGYGSVAANGKIIEQAQILTTHNLATLVRRAGILPEPGWADLACRCFRTVCVLTARVHGNPRPLGTIKDVAYAWRQMLFHLSLCTADEQQRVLDQLDDEAARHPRHVSARLAPALAGLRLGVAGGSFDADGTADGGRARRLLGWSTDGHWLRTDPSPGAGLEPDRG